MGDRGDATTGDCGADESDRGEWSGSIFCDARICIKVRPPMGGVSYRVAVAERSPVAGGVGRGGRGERVLSAARRSASSTVKWCKWRGRRHTDANPIRTK